MAVVVKGSDNDSYKAITPIVQHWQTSSQSSVMTHRSMMFRKFIAVLFETWRQRAETGRHFQARPDAVRWHYRPIPGPAR